jgi:hypothetical protein
MNKEKYENAPYFRKCAKCGKMHNCNRKRSEMDYKKYCETCEVTL